MTKDFDNRAVQRLSTTRHHRIVSILRDRPTKERECECRRRRDSAKRNNLKISGANSCKAHTSLDKLKVSWSVTQISTGGSHSNVCSNDINIGVKGFSGGGYGFADRFTILTYLCPTI